MQHLQNCKSPAFCVKKHAIKGMLTMKQIKKAHKNFEDKIPIVIM